MKVIDSTIKLEDVVVKTNHTKFVASIQWSKDGQYLATTSHDKSVLIYKRL